MGYVNPNLGATFSTTPAAPPVTGPPKNHAQSVLNWFGTPAGDAVTNAVGAGISAYGNYQQNQQNLKQNASQFAANLKQNQYQFDQNNQLNRAQGVLAADPLGANQQYAQKNALLAAILPGLRNYQSTPGDSAVAGAMGSHVGGLRLPEGGLDPNMINQKYGEHATAAAIADHAKHILSLDPNASMPDMGSLFSPEEAAPFQQTLTDWSSNLQKLQGQEKAKYEASIDSYIQQMAAQEQKSGKPGFWHKLAKVAGIVGAGVATVMSAGAATPLLAAAIGAGSGALGAWGSGGNPLLGAVAGGASAGLGAGGAGSGVAKYAKSIASNPALYGAVLGR